MIKKRHTVALLAVFAGSVMPACLDPFPEDPGVGSSDNAVPLPANSTPAGVAPMGGVAPSPTATSAGATSNFASPSSTGAVTTTSNNAGTSATVQEVSPSGSATGPLVPPPVAPSGEHPMESDSDDSVPGDVQGASDAGVASEGLDAGADAGEAGHSPTSNEP